MYIISNHRKFTNTEITKRWIIYTSLIKHFYCKTISQNIYLRWWKNRKRNVKYNRNYLCCFTNYKRFAQDFTFLFLFPFRRVVVIFYGMVPSKIFFLLFFLFHFLFLFIIDFLNDGSFRTPFLQFDHYHQKINR